MPFLNFAPLQNALGLLQESSAKFEAARSRADTNAPSGLTTQVQIGLDAILMKIEQTLTNPNGLPRRPWYRHMVYAPGFYTGYEVKTLPGVREAIEERHWKEAGQQVERVAQNLESFAREIDRATDSNPLVPKVTRMDFLAGSQLQAFFRRSPGVNPHETMNAIPWTLRLPIYQGLLLGLAGAWGGNTLAEGRDPSDFVAGKMVVLNDNGAWSWFMDERSIVDHGHVVVGLVRANGKFTDSDRPGWGNVELSILDIKSLRVERVILKEHLEQDDHAAPGLLVLGDGRYLAAYSKHNQEPRFWFRISVRPGDASAWLPEREVVTPGRQGKWSGDNFTYANPMRLTEEGGRVYLFHRGVTQDPNYYWSDDDGRNWTYGGSSTKDATVTALTQNTLLTARTSFISWLPKTTRGTLTTASITVSSRRERFIEATAAWWHRCLPAPTRPSTPGISRGFTRVAPRMWPG